MGLDNLEVEKFLVEFEILKNQIAISLGVAGLTEGSVLFAGTDGKVTEDNSNFFWDNVNKRLGINTIPLQALDINGNMVLRSSTAPTFSFRPVDVAQWSFLARSGNTNFAIRNAIGTSIMEWQQDGNVGIGTISPNELTHLFGGTATNTALLVDSDNGNDSSVDLMESGAGSGVSDADFGVVGNGFSIIHDGGDNKLFIKSGSGATVNTRMTIDRTTGDVGIGVDPAQKFEIGSDDNTDRISIFHDNSNAQFMWDDGVLKFETDEGTNTDTVVEIRGKGTGTKGQLQVVNSDGTANVLFRATTGGLGRLSAEGGASALQLQHPADIPIQMFSSASEGETPELEISGFRTGDSLRQLEIGVGVDAADTASFDGVSNYLFDGTVKASIIATATETVATLGVGVTTFAITSNVSIVTGDGGGNTIATITGGVNGQLLTLIFTDANVTITDDDTHAADSVDLSAAFTSADDTTLQLVYDGTSWYETSRSIN